jgi:hypothetical protein
MTKTTATPFVPHKAHRAMTPDDAQVFALASEIYVHPNISKAIKDAGGDDGNIAHFSRTHACGRPIVPFASENDHETIVSLLKSTGEALSDV